MSYRKNGAFAGFGATGGLIDPVLYRKAARTLVTLGTRKGRSPAEIAETLLMIGYADSGAPAESASGRLSALADSAPVAPIQTPPERPAAADLEPAIRMCKRGLHPLEGHNRIVRTRADGIRNECRACRNARKRLQRATNTTSNANTNANTSNGPDIRDIVNDLIDTWNYWHNAKTATWISGLSLYAFLQFDATAAAAFIGPNATIPENRHGYLQWLHHALNLDGKPNA